MLPALEVLLEVAIEVLARLAGSSASTGSGSRAPGTPRGSPWLRPGSEWYGRPSMRMRDAVLAPRPSRGSRGPCPAGRARTIVERLPRLAAREVVLVLGDAEQRAPRRRTCCSCHQVRLDERERRVEVADAALGEEVDLLRERRLHDLGRAGDDRAARRCPSCSRTKSARA